MINAIKQIYLFVYSFNSISGSSLLSFLLPFNSFVTLNPITPDIIFTTKKYIEHANTPFLCLFKSIFLLNIKTHS